MRPSRGYSHGGGPHATTGAPAAAAVLSGTDRRAAGVLVCPRRRLAMRTLSAVLALAVVVALWAAPRAAADAKAEREGAGVGLAERIQDLNLTDEQEARIADIRKEYRP